MLRVESKHFNNLKSCSNGKVINDKSTLSSITNKLAPERREKKTNSDNKESSILRTSHQKISSKLSNCTYSWEKETLWSRLLTAVEHAEKNDCEGGAFSLITAKHKNYPFCCCRVKTFMSFLNDILFIKFREGISPRNCLLNVFFLGLEMIFLSCRPEYSSCTLMAILCKFNLKFIKDKLKMQIA